MNDLERALVGEKNLRGVDLRWADLTGADLRGAKLGWKVWWYVRKQKDVIR